MCWISSTDFSQHKICLLAVGFPRVGSWLFAQTLFYVLTASPWNNETGKAKKMRDYHLDEVPQHPDEWMRAMVQQLERTEQASPGQQVASQKNLLLELVKHSIATVPGYKDRLKPLIRANGEISLEGWLDVPVLKRREAVSLGNQLVSQDVPASHGNIKSGATSGSTRMPFVFKVTQFHHTMWTCITARYYRWNNLDYCRSFATISPYSLGTASWPEGRRQDSWAIPALMPDRPGKLYSLNSQTPIDRQIEWLRSIKPDYLHCFPSNIRALALAVEAQGEPLKFRGVLTWAETLTPETRSITSRVFGCNPGDCYSSSECGYMALQSPQSDAWLVQSEVVFLEILDEQDRPCEAGERGRVVVTPLHNYAQPLIRYDLGDLATFGTSDASGLPYPVLSKIHGRTRNMFRFPGGISIQPDFMTVNICHYLNPKQWQVAQIADTALEIRIVPGGDPAMMDTEGMSQYIRALLGMDLTITYKLVADLTNPRTGKHEDYICEI